MTTEPNPPHTQPSCVIVEAIRSLEANRNYWADKAREFEEELEAHKGDRRDFRELIRSNIDTDCKSLEGMITTLVQRYRELERQLEEEKQEHRGTLDAWREEREVLEGQLKTARENALSVSKQSDEALDEDRATDADIVDELDHELGTVPTKLIVRLLDSRLAALESPPAEDEMPEPDGYEELPPQGEAIATLSRIGPGFCCYVTKDGEIEGDPSVDAARWLIAKFDRWQMKQGQ